MITFKRVKGVCPACGHDSSDTNDPCIHERSPELFNEVENEVSTATKRIKVTDWVHV